MGLGNMLGLVCQIVLIGVETGTMTSFKDVIRYIQTSKNKNEVREIIQVAREHLDDLDLLRLAEVKNRLSYNLGMDFDHSPYKQSAIALTFNAILKYHRSGEVDARDLQLAKMELYANQLEYLKDRDRETWRKLRKLTKQKNKADSFFGLRFEVNIAAILLKEKVVLKKQESPDFSIDYKSGKVAIECTSARIKGISEEGKIIEKIDRKLAQYSQNEYANLYTALFIDITNLHFASIDGGIYRNWLPKSRELIQVVEKHKFGSMFLFYYFGRNNIFNPYFSRYDHPRINERLNSFLDTYFSFPKVNPKKVSMVREG